MTIELKTTEDDKVLIENIVAQYCLINKSDSPIDHIGVELLFEYCHAQSTLDLIAIVTADNDIIARTVYDIICNINHTTYELNKGFNPMSLFESKPTLKQAVIKYRIYPDGTIMQEEGFDEVDNSTPVYDDYQTVEVPEDVVAFIEEAMLQSPHINKE